MTADVPILFLVFNRPDLTEAVMRRLAEVRPRRLFVAADGPRADREGEADACERTRHVASQPDWPCEVTTLFRDENLGCGRAVSDAISWFFEHVEEGIILEDDCLPDPTFFEFCAFHLHRYRDDPRVGTVSGNFFLPPSLRLERPYFFSRYAQIWGWATWRRTWERYHFDLSFCPEEEWRRALETACPNPLESRYWWQIIRALLTKTIDTWDYQLMAASFRESWLHVTPSVNLVRNLGYRADATHTRYESALADLAAQSIAGYEADQPVEPSPEIDSLTFYVRFLDSLNSVWWLEQALSLDEKLGWTREESLRQAEELRLLRAVVDKGAEAAAREEVAGVLDEVERTRRELSGAYHYVHDLQELVASLQRQLNGFQAYARRARRYEEESQAQLSYLHGELAQRQDRLKQFEGEVRSLLAASKYERRLRAWVAGLRPPVGNP